MNIKQIAYFYFDDLANPRNNGLVVENHNLFYEYHYNNVNRKGYSNSQLSDDYLYLEVYDLVPFDTIKFYKKLLINSKYGDSDSVFVPKSKSDIKDKYFGGRVENFKFYKKILENPRACDEEYFKYLGLKRK